MDSCLVCYVYISGLLSSPKAERFKCRAWPEHSEQLTSNRDNRDNLLLYQFYKPDESPLESLIGYDHS
jgi:hypothetical protein